jgi:hypothetical protein
VNAKATAILRACSAASGVGGVAGVEVAAAAATPAVAAEPRVTSAAINNVAKAQANRPCAVSRKRTSSVRIPTHFVRRRPAKYPPKADDSHWVTTSHIAATVPKVVGEGLPNDHGETVTRPRPGPRVNNMIVTPKAANAPPNIEAHSTADAELSTDFSATGAAVSSILAIKPNLSGSYSLVAT